MIGKKRPSSIILHNPHHAFQTSTGTKTLASGHQGVNIAKQQNWAKQMRKSSSNTSNNTQICLQLWEGQWTKTTTKQHNINTNQQQRQRRRRIRRRRRTATTNHQQAVHRPGIMHRSSIMGLHHPLLVNKFVCFIICCPIPLPNTLYNIQYLNWEVLRLFVLWWGWNLGEQDLGGLIYLHYRNYPQSSDLPQINTWNHQTNKYKMECHPGLPVALVEVCWTIEGY